MIGSEHDPERRGVRRRWWYVLEDRTHAGVESSVVPGFRIEDREVLVQPAPHVMPGERKRCVRRARNQARGHRHAQRNFAQLEEVGWIDEVIGTRRGWSAARH